MKAFDHGIDASKIIDGDIVEDYSTSTVDVPDRQEPEEEVETEQPSSSTGSTSTSGSGETTSNT